MKTPWKAIIGAILCLSLFGCSSLSYMIFRLEHQMVDVAKDTKRVKISKYEINNWQFRKYLEESGDYHFKSDITKWITFGDEYGDISFSSVYH